MKSQGDYPRLPPRFIVSLTEALRLFFLRANRRLTHPQVVIWERIHQFWLAAGIGVVCELGIADMLRQGPRHITWLARESSTNADALYRLMRMLASQGIFRESGKGNFRSTRLSRALQDDQIRYLAMVHLNPAHFKMFAGLMDSVKSGEARPLDTRGNNLFAHIASDDERNEAFNRAMSNASHMQIPTLLPAYPFRRYRRIVDLGGGQGLFLRALLKVHPGAEGILFDLPQVLDRLELGEDATLLGDRLKIRPGNFFESVPGGEELYMMKSVLHDWDDEDALKILALVRRAMKTGSRLLVIETVLDEKNTPSFGKMTDILMMLAAGGRERTATEWRELLEKGGFRIRRIYPTISPHSIMEALPI